MTGNLNVTPKLALRVVAIALMLLSTPCWSTRPLIDQLELDGSRIEITPKSRPWLDFPENEKTREIRREERCSAIGAPRARWKIADNRLWLIGFFQCKGEIRLETVYGGNGEPILAEWVTAELISQVGKPLCIGSSVSSGILETSIVLKIEKGLVVNVTRYSNRDHPAIATLEDLKELRIQSQVQGITDKDLEKIVEESGWYCLDLATQKKIRGNRIFVPSENGNTFGEFVKDHANKLFEQ